MKIEKDFDAVEMKRKLQKIVEKKYAGMGKSELLETLHRKYGYLMKTKKAA